MKSNYLKVLLIIIALNTQVACGQLHEKEKCYFNFVLNAENFNANIEKPYEGLVMGFSIYNRDQKIGKGGGWLIHKNGTKAADMLANELYPNNSLRGFSFIKDLFGVKNKNPRVDSTMLKDFDIYIYIIDNKFLELRLNIDGEGVGKTYSYYEKYPLNIVVYKREAGEDYFFKYDNFHIEKEEENINWLRYHTDLIKKTAKESNLSR